MPLSVGVGFWTLFASLHVVSWGITGPANSNGPLRSSPNALEVTGDGVLATPISTGVKPLSVMRSEVKDHVSPKMHAQGPALGGSVQLEKQASIPNVNGVAGVAGDVAGAAGELLTPQYMIWDPYVPPPPPLSDAVKKHVPKAMQGVVMDAADVVDKAAEAASKIADSLNPMNRMCLIIDEGLTPPVQVKKCSLVASEESQFIFPEHGQTGPIKQKSSPNRCLGVPKNWWGSSDGKFKPSGLEVTPCDAHVSEHNNSFVMPAKTNGTGYGLIAWSSHPSMCIDIQDVAPPPHANVTEAEIEESPEEQAADAAQKSLLQLSASGTDPTKALSSAGGAGGDAVAGAEKVEVATKGNGREFDGNTVTLAKCQRLGNWSLLPTILPVPPVPLPR